VADASAGAADDEAVASLVALLEEAGGGSLGPFAAATNRARPNANARIAAKTSA